MDDDDDAMKTEDWVFFSISLCPHCGCQITRLSVCPPLSMLQEKRPHNQSLESLAEPLPPSQLNGGAPGLLPPPWVSEWKILGCGWRKRGLEGHPPNIRIKKQCVSFSHEHYHPCSPSLPKGSIHCSHTLSTPTPHPQETCAPCQKNCAIPKNTRTEKKRGRAREEIVPVKRFNCHLYHDAASLSLSLSRGTQ